MTTFSENRETSQNQIKVENYNTTYEDIANVFCKIKNKGILNETIILKGQANYRTEIQRGNRSTKSKSKKHIKNEEEFEL